MKYQIKMPLPTGDLVTLDVMTDFEMQATIDLLNQAQNLKRYLKELADVFQEYQILLNSPAYYNARNLLAQLEHTP